MAQTYFNKDNSFGVLIRKSVKVNNKMRNNKPQIQVTFQESMRVTLICAQAFALMPVSGVLSKNPNDVKFKIKSWKFLYFLLSLLGQIIVTVVYVHKVLHIDTTLGNLIPVMFNGMLCCVILMYFQTAKSWPDLVQYISQIEKQNPNYDNKLTVKCNVTCFVVLGLALLEKILFMVTLLAKASVCYHTQPDSYEAFVKVVSPVIFKYIPFSTTLGLFVQFQQLQTDFIRNYSDLFVICISYNLISHLEQINKKLKSARGKYLPEKFWRSTREEYDRAMQLVRKVDEVISGVVFISYANDLFCICLLLFNALQDGIKGSTEFNSCSNQNTLFNGYKASTFFTFSLLHLIVRSMVVSLTASQINTASLVPASILYEVPSPVYCVEVQRFLEQVNGDNVALTGLQFFSVTRGWLLTVAGTIVTYELVMFQFDSPLFQDNTTEYFIPNITTGGIP